ncbi:hypothetical protein ABB37_04991 [Leptomonas pyrrhocoris]|uniref:Calpain catalytic domain-containing protein n=1 Tax=Leptomonas pyrrhocoris TaxID=157538 RepID=A0A0N0DV73_LEPPY|nr:hypothetical protein ABB37_04991 [Leptomonas pyrrhocoris]XP_015658380.1 hypothetical protein ABB37_04991 [Leptomonas pyrrhocoris]XP_015658381.1 hypothetical protein ABB37_04991 [Leptomonas pyrrhocoris]KPA79940.1 hypothetical protein ABB37_04991 [Leptomonas pyrrhocoris]KPA79941.1 hypothetical protein ABB37_04991 [Leptomonas pyrrhocoris]KPA79942.1 hypothetical protein ABB37_04991 [Leptomonas pyrrhocoris]|eukprot:XP_015658379.1 hypothetical protein ABB37_04991 [Leptomonas pyrrhocoris]
MHRPGVDYWANTHSPTQTPQTVHILSRRSAASSSSGPPSLSRTSTTDFYIPSDDAPQAGATSGLAHCEPIASPLPSHNGSLPPATASFPPMRGNLTQLTELEAAKKQVAQLQQQQRQEEERVRRMQATWMREGVEYGNTLQTLRASLEREHALRTSAEQERQYAVREGQQLRVALRAVLAEPPSANGTPSTDTARGTVPLALYEEARRLLARCEHTFAELKMLQLRATDPAGLERLRCYDVPVVDGIPPAWPLETPQKVRNDGMSKEGDVRDSPSSTMRQQGGNAVLRTPKSTKAAATATPLREETPTGPDVSALTTVSPDTPCSLIAPDHTANTSPTLYHSESCASQKKTADVEMQSAAPVSASTAAPQVISAANNDAAGGARRVLLSPPLFSSSADVVDAPQGKQKETTETHTDGGADAEWSGPMHEFAADDGAHGSAAAAPTTMATTTTVATSTNARAAPSTSRLRPQPGAVLSEFEREDIIRDTDQLIRQLSRETIALARNEGARSSTDVAALCRRRGLDYIDPIFLPVTETLGLAAGGCRGYDPDEGSSYIVQWCTRDAFTPEGQRPAPLLTSAGIDPNALRCGRLGDTGVVAALAALAEAAGAVTSVLASTTAAEAENGLYVVWMCVRGWWMRVTVDAYLPCLCEADQTVTLYGCRNVATHELWAPICEKALAKVYGSYQALPHLPADVVVGHLTGGPVECWEWWRRSSETALEEIEAAINTSARGAGMVLLTTHSAAVLRGDSSKASLAGARAEYERLGLLPGTSYRVLAVTENADGEAVLLLRNWTTASSSSRAGGTARVGNKERDCREMSPLRDDESTKGPMLDYVSNRSGAVVVQNDGSSCANEGCVWLNYTRQVLPLFDRCHTCFDCRRFHDVRFPVHFSGSAPAVPAEMIRVRVQDPRRRRSTRGVTPCPTRLWIGLHQPGSHGEDCDAPAVPWALKVTLIGQEDASLLYAGRGSHRSDYGGSGFAAAAVAAPPPPLTRPARRSYVLSESFMGEPQPLPAVWMYLELDADDLARSAGTNSDEAGDDDERDNNATVMEFFVVPQMELTGTVAQDSRERVAVRGGVEVDRNRRDSPLSKGFTHRHTQEDAEEFYDEARPAWLRRDLASSVTIDNEFSFGTRTTAIVAILAEDQDCVTVDVVQAPAELRAALYHDVVDRIDFSECAPMPSGRADRCRRPASPNKSIAAVSNNVEDVRCQVNGRCLPTFSW